LRQIFTLTGIITLLIHIVLFAMTIVIYRNFGKGLKDLEFIRKGKKKPNLQEEDLSDNEDPDYVEYNDSEGTPEQGGDWTLFDVIRNTYALDRGKIQGVTRM